MAGYAAFGRPGHPVDGSIRFTAVSRGALQRLSGAVRPEPFTLSTVTVERTVHTLPFAGGPVVTPPNGAAVHVPPGTAGVGMDDLDSRPPAEIRPHDLSVAMGFVPAAR